MAAEAVAVDDGLLGVLGARGNPASQRDRNDNQELAGVRFPLRRGTHFVVRMQPLDYKGSRRRMGALPPVWGPG